MSDQSATNGEVKGESNGSAPSLAYTDRQLEVMAALVNNYGASRRDWIRLLTDPRRNIEKECGYPEGPIEVEFYQNLYNRFSIAARVVKLLPREMWQVQPNVYEDEDPDTDTDFESAWNELGQGLRGEQCWHLDQEGSAVWEYLQRVDELSGIGQYGVLLLGFDDGQPLNQPLKARAVRTGPLVSKDSTKEFPSGPQGDTGDGTDVPPSPKPAAKPSQPKPKLGKKPPTGNTLTLNQLVSMEMPSEPTEKVQAVLDKMAVNAPANFPSQGSTTYAVDGTAREKNAQYDGRELPPDPAKGFGKTPKGFGKPSAGGPRLTYLRVFPEALAPVIQFETNVASPRYGQPVSYLLTFNDPRGNAQGTGVGLSSASMQVHWTRVIHVADTLESSEVFGQPRMRPHVDHLLALKKVYGASGEGYWKSSFVQVSWESQDGDTEVNIPAMRGVIESFRNSLQPDILSQGLSAKPIAPNVVDPTAIITAHLTAIAIEIGCPMRVLMGSERGQLASGQDDGKWNDVVKQRWFAYAVPRLVCPFVDRLIAVGTLPQPEGGYKVHIPDLESATAASKAAVLLQRTQAYGAYVAQGVEAVIPPLEYMTEFDDMTVDKAQSILDSAEQHQEETQANEMQQQQDMIDKGLAPDPTKPDPNMQAKLQAGVPAAGGKGAPFPPKPSLNAESIGDLLGIVFNKVSVPEGGHWVTYEGKHLYVLPNHGGFYRFKKGKKNAGSSARGEAGGGRGGPAGDSGRVAGTAGATGSKGGDRGGDSGGKSAGDPAAEVVPASIGEVKAKIDRMADLFRRKGQHQAAEWMDSLKHHVETTGNAEDLLKSLGESKGRGTSEEVQYGGINTEDSPNWASSSQFITDYLNRTGIIPLVGQKVDDRKIIHSQTNDDPFTKKGGGRARKPIDFQPVGPAYDDKLQESKDLPGLERSEDIGKVMGKKVTYLTPEVLDKMNATYGTDNWLIKTYGDYAFAGQGIFFPQRVRQMTADAKSTIWTAGEHLDKYGFKIARDPDSGEAKGIVHASGDLYRFGSKRYAETIHGDARHWADKAAAAAENEQGVKLPFGGKDFMVQPAFAAVGVSEKDRAEGKTIAPGEGRVHVVIRNGKAEAIPHATWIKGESLPVVFETEDTKAMAKAAEDAINALPAKARAGQIYAPDVLKTKDGYKVVELNASVEYGGSGYLSDNPLVIDSFVSHLTNRDPAHVRFIRNLLTKKALTKNVRWAILSLNYSPDQPRATDGKFGHGIVATLKGIGSKVKHAEHVAKTYAEDRIADAVGRLPAPAQTVVKHAFALGKTGTKALFATWIAGQNAAERISRAKGSTAEQARKLRGLLSGIDIAVMKPIQIALGSTGLGHAALPASFVPPATAAYLAYSTARHPLATIRAAGAAVLEASRGAYGKLKRWSNPAKTGPYAAFSNNEETLGGVESYLADTLEHYGYSDWFVALLSASLDLTHDLPSALDLAQKAANHFPEDTSSPREDDAEKILGGGGMVDNSFCATGEGGGVDPSCSPKSGKEKFIGAKVGKAGHVHSAKAEQEVAAATGTEWEEDNKAYDVREEGRHAMEVKTFQNGGKNVISVHPDALLRKVKHIKENPTEVYHTVVLDDRDTFEGGKHAAKHSGHRIYYKRGSGRYNIAKMYKVDSIDQLRGLMDAADKDLPKAARGSLPKGKELKKLKDQAESAHDSRLAKDRKYKAELKAKKAGGV